MLGGWVCECGSDNCTLKGGHIKHLGALSSQMTGSREIPFQVEWAIEQVNFFNPHPLPREVLTPPKGRCHQLSTWGSRTFPSGLYLRACWPPPSHMYMRPSPPTLLVAVSPPFWACCLLIVLCWAECLDLQNKKVEEAPHLLLNL